MDEVLQWFDGLSPLWTYASLFASALIEYLFPPFPGDTVTLVGAFLSGSAGLPWWMVWLSLTAGSTLGGTIAWRFGCSLRKRQDKWPGFSGDETTRRRLDKLQARFEKRGAVYLAVNRFVPAFRALFFVGAGLSGLPLRAVVLWGAVSAALWNGAVMAAGFAMGTNLDALETLFTRYRTGAWVVLAGIALIALVVWLVRRRRSSAAS